jgi:hypothetical protein
VTFANGASLSNTSNGNAWYVPTITLQGTLNLISTQRQNLSFNTLELTSGTKTINANGKSVAVTGGTTLGSESTGLSQWEMQNITALGTSTIQSSSSAGVLAFETTAFTGQTVGSGTGNYAAMRINNATSFSNTDLIIGNNVLLFAANTGTLGSNATTSPNVTVNGILNLVASSATGRTVSVKSLTGAGSVFGSMTAANTNTTTLALNGTSGSTTFSGVISNGPGTGALALTKSGGSTQILSGTNTYTGNTTVSGGTLTIASTGTINSSSGVLIGAGNFNYNSSTALTPAITFTGTGGTLSGSGTVGAITLTTGNTISPGNSPGTLTTGNEVWNGGATYVWEINNATGTTPGTDWDFISSTGSLDISALTSLSKFNVNVVGLTSGNLSGVVPSWVDGNASWKIASFTSIVGTFASDLFNVDATGFTNNNTAVGLFTITNTGNDIYLTYAIPEPTTYAALAGALALVGAMVYRRRRS